MRRSKNQYPIKTHAFSAYLRDRYNANLFNKFQYLQAHLKPKTEESKLKYYLRLPNRLLDSKTSPKLYWSILKTFLNNKKILCIPPLLQNGKFIMDFKEKTEFFNDFFTKQCSLVNNNSKLLSVLTKKRVSRFHWLSFRHMISWKWKEILTQTKLTVTIW